MNKNPIFGYTTAFALLILLCGNIHAQEVIASSGSLEQNSSGSLTSTLGELVIETQSNGNTTMTQGFHQTKLTVTAINDLFKSSFSILAFPNPTNDFVTLKIDKGESQNIEYLLFDQQGKQLLTGKVSNNESEISFVSFNPGSYFIKVLNKGKEIQTFKIVKQ